MKNVDKGVEGRQESRCQGHSCALHMVDLPRRRCGGSWLQAGGHGRCHVAVPGVLTAWILEDWLRSTSLRLLSEEAQRQEGAS